MSVSYSVIEAQSSYHAISMARIRLGANCMILSVEENHGALTRIKAVSGIYEKHIEIVSKIIDILEYAGFSSCFIEQSLSNVDYHSSNIEEIMSNIFNYPDINIYNNSAIILVGATGCGKTSTAAKLSLYYYIHSIKPGIVSCDTGKTCGALQLVKIMKKVSLPVTITDSTEELFEYVSKHDYNVIDTGGINIRNIKDYKMLQNLVNCINAVPVLVLRSDMSGSEVYELSSAFSHIGAKHCIITHLDAFDRCGAVVEAVMQCDIMPVLLSSSQYVTDQLRNSNMLYKFIINSYVSNGKTTKKTTNEQYL